MTQVELYSRSHLVLATIASEYDRRAQAYGCVIITEGYSIGDSLATTAATKQVCIRDAGGTNTHTHAHTHMHTHKLPNVYTHTHMRARAHTHSHTHTHAHTHTLAWVHASSR